MPEPLSREDVAHLAGLARIDLDDAELDHLAAELPAILEHVAVVQSAVADAEAEHGELTSMSHPQPISNVLREDVAVPGLTPEEALAGAPGSEQQRFLVPRILGEGS